MNENFELNIAERRITERDFYASTAIETEAGDARGLSLRVGVAVGASEMTGSFATCAELALSRSLEVCAACSMRAPGGGGGDAASVLESGYSPYCREMAGVLSRPFA